MNVLEKECIKCHKIVAFKSKKYFDRAKQKNEYLCKSCASFLAHKGKTISEENRLKLRMLRLGTKASEETRKKLSGIHRGKNNSCYGRVEKNHPMYGKSGILSPTYGMAPWNKNKKNPFSNEAIKKIKESSRGRWSGKSNPNFGNHDPLSEEHKRKLRLSHINRIQQIKLMGYQLKPNFNIGACKIIDEYGKQHGYNFQHAMNGGEYFIEHLGFWVDGYDKTKNVVIDYYENNHHHYNKDGSMKKRDLLRIDEIKRHLKCNFIVLEEKSL
jgi:hypothetical protein